MAEEIKIDQQTLDEQFNSSDPANSAWVSANAGSGKTYVLTQRVIRLLLEGVAPDRILCLTFTKAAAANMKNRVFETLSEWTMLPDDKLEDAIRKSTGKKPDATVRKNARKLFAKALDTPGGLKIQTIHGFCEALLHQFPLEANVPGHFETVQDLEQSELLAQATSDVLSGRNGQNDETTSHHEALIPEASDQAIAEGIREIISNRDDFLGWTKPGIDNAIDELYAHFRITKEDTAQTIKQVTMDRLPVSDELLESAYQQAVKSSATTDAKLAERLGTFLHSGDIDSRFDAISEACLTTQGKVRTERSLATKAVKEAVPELAEALTHCGEFLLAEAGHFHAPQLIRNSRHIFELGTAILERYQTMKRQRALVDFDDQIERAANLLNRADIRDWIRYRLDLGVDHVLVDEAQDTSPVQWQIINAITEDFHTGETASRRDRTVFVVGDEKQSIFSFQGAEPREFGRQQRLLRRKVDSVGMPFHAGRLNLSFRSTSDVLKAVDLVFEVDENKKGLSGDNLAPVHSAVREKHPGEVQVWPLYVKPEREQTESWTDPIDRTHDDDPEIQLARRISREVASMVGSPLPGMDRPLEYRDILVLVRSRQPVFINALTRSMKDDGIAVAGSDRLRLAEHVAVEDLIAIGRASILPQDDLSLACVLKSLFFNLPEEALFAFAHDRGRETSLFARIAQIAAEREHPYRQLAGDTLQELEEVFSLARTTSVFGFYARLLGEFGGRRKILARLGSEAEDVIEAFLDEALIHARDRDGGLESFLSGLVRTNPEIKREVELNRNEVRILTVHASKGLEAPVVFLVDSCGPAWNERHRPSLLPLPSKKTHAPRIWLPSTSLHTPETRAATTLIQTESEGEYRRLLYVGMTRAADKLVVCGYQRRKTVNHPHWHRMVHDALAPTATTVTDDDGNIQAWRWIEKERKQRPLKTEQHKKAANKHPDDVPDWLFWPAKTDPPLPRPLSPSGASVLIEGDTSDGKMSGMPEPSADNRFALQRGNITHRLLETLPELAPEIRRERAASYVRNAASDWQEEQIMSVLEDVFGILENPDYKTLFDGQGIAEVSVGGWVETGLGKLQVSGQIDRLTVSEQQVTILDYKTNRNVPHSHQTVPFEYRVQLALYRQMIREIYPDKTATCALIWTRTPEMMILPDNLLDETLELFKKQ